ncbi:MAG: bile acid:sodium symporter family protein [Bacteroidetes bacterium]|nr:bile acid:sodium symporter family protein [Bacteroidota bacterium]
MDKVSTIFLALSLIIIMLGMGLSLTLDDFKRVFVYPKAIFVGLANQIILLPLIGFALVSAFSSKPEIAIGIMILAACPGGPTSNLLSHLAKGDIALSVSLTAISSLITIITIPFIVNFALIRFLAEGQMIQLNLLETIIQISVIIVVPIVIGMTIRRYKETFAMRMEKPVRKASAIVIILVILGVVFKEKDNLLFYFQEAGIIALSLNAATMFVGYYSAKLFKIKNKQAISISIESGIQNGTLAITIAVVLLGNSTFSIAPMIYSLLMFFTGGLAILLSLKKKEKPVEVNT